MVSTCFFSEGCGLRAASDRGSASTAYSAVTHASARIDLRRSIYKRDSNIRDYHTHVAQAARLCCERSEPAPGLRPVRTSGPPVPRGSIRIPHMRPVFTWNLGQRSLELGKRTLVMGVVNVTPDSFS